MRPSNVPNPTIVDIDKNINKAFASVRDGDTISQLLSLINLNPILPILFDRYTNDWHFRYPPLPMLKATIFKELKDIKFDTRLIKYLKKHPEEAFDLGFYKDKDEILTPSRRVFNHFINNRIDEEIKDIIKWIVSRIRELSEKQGILFADAIKIDCINVKESSDRTIRRKKNQKIRDLCRVSKKYIFPYIEIRLGQNATYKKNDFLDLLLHTAITNDFAENGSKTFREIFKRDVPSGDDLLYHLKKFEDKEVVEEMFMHAFDIIFSIARSSNPDYFNRKVDVGIDFTDWMYYGNKNDEMVLGTQPKNGTSYAYKFASVYVVENGIRFTLLALPIERYSEMIDVVVKLVEYAKKKVKINRVFCDRWFYQVPIIRAFKRLGVHFIIQAQKTTGIKKVIEKNTDKDVIVVGYRMQRKRKAPSGKEDVKLFIVPHRLKKDEKVCFVTDLDVDESSAKGYAELFRRRWGIETSYRVKGDFRPKTTSKNYIIRLFYFLFSVCMYNLWVVINSVLSMLLYGKLPKKPLLTAKMFIAVIQNIDYSKSPPI